MKTDTALHLKHREVTEKIIQGFYAVYNHFGFGFLESVYERAMMLELEANGSSVRSQVPIDVFYRGQVIGEFRADLVVEDKVLVELKAARAIEPAFEAQLLHYLKATQMEVGLLLNFGHKPEFKRFLFDNPRKKNP
jgi:GxxExxY protein